MKEWLRRALIIFLAAWMLLGLILPVLADETTPEEQQEPFVSIHTPEELQAIAQNPSGNYRLEADLDMTGIPWEPMDFSGVFDGGGHALLNLELTKAGPTQDEVLDGNRKAYQAEFVGMFGKIENAEIRDLHLYNVRSVYTTENPCFLGGLAGCSFGSQITGCTVTGVLELRAYNQIFGVGGVVGYGSGGVHNSKINVTLICVDTDSTTKDEQFLGGVYATGFMDVTHCNIEIVGCASEHGYAHNGGITGMFMQTPLGLGKVGEISYNKVSGQITFFEDNRDRRAYCDAYYGEILASSYILYDNRRDFKRIELKTYDKEIRPCMCEEPDIHTWPVSFGCEKNQFGHTISECYSCAYLERSKYTMMTHTVTDWTVVEPATLAQEGLSEGNCDYCGVYQTRVEPMLVPEETDPRQAALAAKEELLQQNAQKLEQERAKVQAERKQMEGRLGKLVILLAGVMVVLVGLIIYLVIDLTKSKKQSK